MLRPLIITVPSLPTAAMALFPFVLVKKKEYKTNPILINHEKIHLRQQLELLIVLFYLLYLINYLVNLLRGKNHYQAYRNIIFEKEAYSMETHFSYLKKRKFLAWYHFL